MGCISWLAGRILCLVNLFFFLSGGVLLGICIYLAVDSSGLFIQGVVIPGAPSEGVWSTAVYLGIAIGAFCFVVGFLGCCGVRKDNRCMLNLYLTFVVICISLEIVVAILALVFNSQLSTTVAVNMQNNVKTEYTNQNAINSNNPSVSYNWNVVQSEWQCCGSYSYKDYWGSLFTNSTGLAVPYECCTRKPGTPKSDMSESNVQDYSACLTEATQGVTGTKQYLYSEGCYNKASNWVKQQSTMLLWIAFSFGVLQVVGMVLAMCYKGGMDKGGIV